jgi:ribosomal protein L29
MELKELRQRSIKELQKLLTKERETLRASKFSVSAKQLKDIKIIKKTKKLIARIITIINQKNKEGEI